MVTAVGQRVPDSIKQPLDKINESIQSFFGGCFAAGTLVATEEGLCPIEQLIAGQRVWAFDVVRSQWALRPIVETYRFVHQGKLVCIETAGSRVESTPNHPYWVIAGEHLAQRPIPQEAEGDYLPESAHPGRWVNAGDLRPGDLLLLKDGQHAPIEATSTCPVVQDVYNFQVQDLHTYAVGPQGVLVHNNAQCKVGNGAGGVAPSNVFGRLVSELDLPKDAQRALLREAMGTLGTGKVAHHLIPLEAITKFKDLMQKAARGGFNINGKNNGISLLKDIEHFGGHPGYNQIVLEELGRIRSLANSARLSDKEVAELVQEAADKLRRAITETNFKPDF